MRRPINPAADPPGAPSQVMLLSVWLDADAAWHARLVTADARSHEFSSPFALAQFLGQPLRLGPAPPPRGDGLR